MYDEAKLRRTIEADLAASSLRDRLPAAKFDVVRQLAVDLALQHPSDSEKETIRRAHQHLATLVERLPDTNGPESDRFALSRREPAAVGQLLVETLTPAIENLREGLFGSRKPPFRSRARAVQWIEKAAVHTCDEPEALDTERRVMAELGQRINAARDALPWLEITHGWRPRRLRYAAERKDKSLELREAPFTRDSPLSPIATLARLFARHADLPEHAVVAHVLTGAPLKLPPAYWTTYERSFKTARDERMTRVSAEITLPSLLDVTLDDLRRIFLQLRAHAGLARRKKLSDKDGRLLQLIEKLGGVPRSGKGAFWERVRQEWARTTPASWGGRPRTWNAMMMRHREILRRVGTNDESGARRPRRRERSS